jgi:hypothetical protein
MRASSFDKARKFILLYLVAPPFLLLDALFGSFYNVFLAWWLKPRLTRSLERRLENDIKAEHFWLFQRYGATVVPQAESHHQYFDHANVCLRVDTLLLNFAKNRGEFDIYISPVHAPKDYYYIDEAIILACGRASIGNTSRFHRMSDFPRLFQTNFDCLRSYFSEEQYGPARRS